MKFDRPVALNSNTHRQLRFRPTGGYGFAGRLHSAPICASEFFIAAKEYAIVFVRAANLTMCPVVVLGLKPDENLFVSDDGQWNGRYLPAALRSYPFAFIESGDHSSLQILIDEAYPGFGSEEGTALFSEQGEPAPELTGKLEFIRAYQRDIGATQRFGAELDRLNLLTERSAQFQLADGSTFQLNGFWIVDETKLSAVPDEELLRLARGGYLSLITAHQLSIGNLSLLSPKFSPPKEVAETAAATRSTMKSKATAHAKA
jgi:SapC